MRLFTFLFLVNYVLTRVIFFKIVFPSIDLLVLLFVHYEMKRHNICYFAAYANLLLAIVILTPLLLTFNFMFHFLLCRIWSIQGKIYIRQFYGP